MRELPLIACSLDAGGMAERGDEFRELFGTALVHVDRRGRGAVLTFRLEAGPAVRDLFAREKECCPFWSFDVAETPDSITVAVGAPVEAESLIDTLLGLAGA